MTGRRVLGWAKLEGARRLHYFPRGQSLSICGAWDYTDRVIKSGAVPLPTCKACLAALQRNRKNDK